MQYKSKFSIYTSFRTNDDTFTRRKESVNIYSMSLCSSSNRPFQSKFFKDSLQTPGQDNNCDYIYIQNTENIDPFEAMQNLEAIDDDEEIQTPGEFIEAIHASGMTIGSEVEVPYSEEDFHNCPLQSLEVKRDMGEMELSIDEMVARIARLYPLHYSTKEHEEDHLYTKKLWTESFLKHDDIVFMRSNLAHLVPVSSMELDHVWVELLRNDTHPESSRYRFVWLSKRYLRKHFLS